jgi:hypothetical protein
MSTIVLSEAAKMAVALLDEIEKHRKDEGQGISVIYAKGDESITLAVTQKPGSGGWRGGAGGGGGGPEPRSKEEIEAKLKEAGISALDSAVAVENGKVFVKWPYKDKDNAVMAALKLGWDAEKKARWAPLKGAPAPSP